MVREKGGRGLRSVERKNKLTKIKAAMKVCQNTDPSIKAVQKFEERVVEKVKTQLMREAHKFAEKLDTIHPLEYPEPLCRFVRDLEKEIIEPKVK